MSFVIFMQIRGMTGIDDLEIYGRVWSLGKNQELLFR